VAPNPDHVRRYTTMPGFSGPMLYGTDADALSVLDLRPDPLPQRGPDQRLCHVEHPWVLNAPSLALTVTTVWPWSMLLAMIASALPDVSLSRAQ
jgi:hypothetical protein